jgi:hypothetical protein
MSNVVTVKGTLLAGPPKSSCNGFPSGLVNAAFELTPPNKVAAVSCYGSPNVNSPSSFVELDGVGAGNTVTQGTFLYIRTVGAMTIRITQGSGGGAVVSTLNVQGLYMQEFPAGTPLTLLEAQGVGVIEYFVSGNL